MLFQLSRDEGARADDGHVAGHDIEELGQLVERCLAQDAAHGGDAGVVERVGRKSPRVWSTKPTS